MGVSDILRWYPVTTCAESSFKLQSEPLVVFVVLRHDTFTSTVHVEWAFRSREAAESYIKGKQFEIEWPFGYVWVFDGSERLPRYVARQFVHPALYGIGTYGVIDADRDWVDGRYWTIAVVPYGA